jgi:hypothetical protein
MPESVLDEKAAEVAGRMGDAPNRGRRGNVSAGAYLSGVLARCLFGWTRLVVLSL